MENKVTNIDALLKKIDFYFECVLTDEEERELRNELEHVAIDHPLIEEAKAVMGFKTIIRRRGQAHSPKYVLKSRFYSAIRVAVAVTVIISVAATVRTLVTENVDSAQECIAYVNGCSVTDEDEVMSILQQNIEELDEGLNDLREEIFGDVEILAPIIDG